MSQTNSLYVTSFITLERWTQLFIQQNTTKKEERSCDFITIKRLVKPLLITPTSLSDTSYILGF